MQAGPHNVKNVKFDYACGDIWHLLNLNMINQKSG